MGLAILETERLSGVRQDVVIEPKALFIPEEWMQILQIGGMFKGKKDKTVRPAPPIVLNPGEAVKLRRGKTHWEVVVESHK